MCKIAKESVLIAIVLPLFVSCSSVNSSSVVVKRDNNTVPVETIQSKSLATKPNRTTVKKIRAPKREEEQPQEVARVCFDKSGKAHNCNYKSNSTESIKFPVL